MLKKHDRVEFKTKDGIGYGVITSVSAKTGKVKVTLDGGERTGSGHFSIFKLSDHPLPTDPVGGAMAEWAVKKYKDYPSMSEETTCYEATITRNGKPVIRGSNRGHGACDDFDALHPHGTYDDVRDFSKACEKWVKENASKDHIEPEGMWVLYYATYRPYGTTSKDFFKQWEK